MVNFLQVFLVYERERKLDDARGSPHEIARDDSGSKDWVNEQSLKPWSVSPNDRHSSC
jgi:hypothetical protein